MIRRRTQRAFLALVLVLAAKSVCADIVQPIGVQIREQEPNAFLVQWSVPQTYPVQAMPEPVLPEDCRPTGERVLREQVGTWLNRQVFRCQDGLTGRELGIRYPFVSAGQSAMIRLELLSGEQLIHALNPGEDSWLVPELDAGLTAELWSNLQRAVLDGVRHFLGGWLHLALWLTLVLLANARLSLRLVGAFTAAQLVALLLNGLVGSSLPPGMAEAGVAIAVVLLAGQTLLPPEARRQLISVTAVAGLIHGLGLPQILPGPLSFSSVEWLYHLLTILGMDATFLGLTLIATGLLGRRGEPSRPGTVRRVVSYGLGAAGAAAGLFLVLAAPVADAGAAQGAGQLPTLPGSTEGATVAGSRRVAAQGTQAPLQSFLSVQAFEVRHQVLVQIRDLRSELDLEDVEELSVEAQPGVKARLEQMTLPLAIVAIDGEPAAPIVDRIDFLTVGTQGVLPRSEPLLERVEEAYLGVTLIYLTSRTPEEVELTWQRFPVGVESVPATVSDPEFSQTTTLTAENPVLAWQNRLSVDLIPTISAIEVEPRVLLLPLLALPIVVLALFLAVAGLRDGASNQRLAWSRVALAVSLILAPVGDVAVAMPSAVSAVPSAGEARRILAGVLPNVYRAFEFREESAAYDRLAVSVTGDTLSQIYLEHRRALEMEERGGARARVEAVEVQEVRSVSQLDGGGFLTEAVWVVGGTVTHFGHRHFRQNRYDAQVSLVPVDGMWKIRAIELFDEERLR